jgi:sulfate adenylyltransferase subunit 1 (EFTu-like GTPase family)
MNDIGRVHLTLAQPVFADPMKRIARPAASSSATKLTNDTVAAGMIR